MLDQIYFGPRQELDQQIDVAIGPQLTPRGGPGMPGPYTATSPWRGMLLIVYRYATKNSRWNGKSTLPSAWRG